MKVAILFGGIGPEREVSLASGESVIAAVRAAGWSVLPVEVTESGDFSVTGEVLGPAMAADRLLNATVQAAFVALHGPFGEDGAVQGFLKVAKIPFTGPDVESAALAMNKHVTRLLLMDAGVPVPPGVLLREPRIPPDLALPAVVKPCRLGSSVGITIAQHRTQLETAVQDVLAMGQECLVEEYIPGREFSCPVWDRLDGPRALPVLEIRPDPARPFFDYIAKYEDGEAEEIVRTESDPIVDRLKELAIRCHRILGCRSFSRTDFMVDDRRGPFVLEINTIPGLTSQSLLPKALRAAGYTLTDLVRESIDQAVGRHSVTA